MDTSSYQSPPWIEYAEDIVQQEERPSAPGPLTPNQSLPGQLSPSTDSSDSAQDQTDNLQQSASAQPLLLPPPPPLQLQQHQLEPTIEDKSDELELGDDILELLGDAPIPESPLGPPIHKDIARRWQDTLTKGLAKDVKESLMMNYLIPINCNFLQAPALNPEVKAALPDPLVKRDMSLLYKQKQLGMALSALATATNMVISNEASKQKILKPLSDACRILCDSHFTETKTRRNFVISSINAKLKSALIESNRDTLLFGENVSEKLKAAKTIQQTGEALKNAQRPRFVRQNTGSTNNKGNLNSTPLHRKTDTKSANHQRTSSFIQRQQQSSNSSQRRPNDRPSSGKTRVPYRR